MEIQPFVHSLFSLLATPTGVVVLFLTLIFVLALNFFTYLFSFSRMTKNWETILGTMNIYQDRTGDLLREQDRLKEVYLSSIDDAFARLDRKLVLLLDEQRGIVREETKKENERARRNERLRGKRGSGKSKSRGEHSE